MHPILFQFEVPEFLQGIFPSQVTIYSYGALIALGAFLGYMYTSIKAGKKFGLSHETVQLFVILVIIAAVVGGKFFMIFEDPKDFAGDPGSLLTDFGSGFVFYGSLIFAIPTIIIFLKVKKIPVWPFLDVVAILTTIVHAFGRMGCFMAGCCYGVPHDTFPSVTFSHPKSQAEPLDTPLHPTQLYSAFSIALIGMFLVWYEKRKRFDGELMLLYIMLYAIARSVIEIFRGDIQRGYVIEGLLSNSQFISLLMFTAAAWMYNRMWKKQQLRNKIRASGRK
jgi:phosphatidylglycerol:prolipoprotein diacylglycerol transferase